jgi:hypothetical protein
MQPSITVPKLTHPKARIIRQKTDWKTDRKTDTTFSFSFILYGKKTDEKPTLSIG